MADFLKAFDLTFTVEGPVFIGSGEVRTNKEYVEGEKTVYFPDMAKLYAAIPDAQRSSFEAFVMNSSTGGDQRAARRLGDWLRGHGMAPNVNLMGGYGVKRGDVVGAKVIHNRGGSRGGGQIPPMNDIHMFIKNAFGEPYVPGSSVKGMLRTLFLQRMLLSRPAVPASAGRPGQPSKPVNRLPGTDRREWEAFAKTQENKFLRRANREDVRNPDDAVNDIFQGIRVADSPPIPASQLLIVQKVDRNVKGNNAGMPLYREALNIGTIFTVRVTVDTSPKQWGGFPEGLGFIQNLEGMAKSIYAQRYAPYIDKYWDDENPFVGEPIVYLGGGAGYRSKTIVEDQEDMAKVLESQFRKVAHREKTRQLGVSPLALKITKADGDFFEMGQCLISVKPVS